MSTVSRTRFYNALRRMAEKAHEGISHVGFANYAEREREAHEWINDLLERELQPRPTRKRKERKL